MSTNDAIETALILMAITVAFASAWVAAEWYSHIDEQ
jgi:hypothetical protein